MNLSPHLLCEEEAHPRGKILRFAGEADFIAVPAVRQLLKKLLGQRIPFLIVDLSGVTFLNTPFWASSLAISTSPPIAPRPIRRSANASTSR